MHIKISTSAPPGSSLTLLAVHLELEIIAF
jgi:hypothetical protein